MARKEKRPVTKAKTQVRMAKRLSTNNVTNPPIVNTVRIPIAMMGKFVYNEDLGVANGKLRLGSFKGGGGGGTKRKGSSSLSLIFFFMFRCA